MKSTMKNKYENIFLAGFIYALLFIVFLFNFFDTDDYSMQRFVSSATMLKGLDFSIHYGNGRFIGNLALYCFNCFPLIRIVAKPLVLTVMVLCMFYVFDINKFWMKATTSLLVILPSSGFYAKCYSSNPCMMNYVAPLTNVFVCFALMKFICKKRRKSNIFFYEF